MSRPVRDEMPKAEVRADADRARRTESPTVPHQVLRLQALAGNRAVTSLLRPAPLAVQRQNEGPRTQGERYDAPQPGDPAPSGGMPGAGMNNVGSRALGNGTLQWKLEPRPGFVNARIQFTPTAAIAAISKTIAFVQTVSTADTTGGFLGLFDDVPKFHRGGRAAGRTRSLLRRAVERSGGHLGRRARLHPGPARRLPGTGRPARGEPSATASAKSAVLNDSPMLQLNQSKQFETAAVIVETGQLLCSLTWSIQRWEAGFFGNDSSTIVQTATAHDAPTPALQTALDRFYSGKVSLGGFAPGSAALPSDHAAVVGPIVARMQGSTGLTVILGGAATADEPDPPGLSRRRAEAVRGFLQGAGIAESRIQIEAYGSDWARAPSSRPDAAQANRRVEINVFQPRPP